MTGVKNRIGAQMKNLRKGDAVMAIAILTALKELNAQLANEKIDPLGYKYEPIKLDPILDADSDTLTSEFVLPPLFDSSNTPDNLLLVDKIVTLLDRSEAAVTEVIERYVAEFGESELIDSVIEVVKGSNEDFLDSEEGKLDQTETDVDPPLVNTDVFMPVELTPEASLEGGQAELLVSEDLPTVNIDPRGEGRFESSDPTLQTTLDVLDQLHDKIPEPIVSKGTDTYNQLTGGLDDQKP